MINVSDTIAVDAEPPPRSRNIRIRPRRVPLREQFGTPPQAELRRSRVIVTDGARGGLYVRWESDCEHTTTFPHEVFTVTTKTNLDSKTTH